MGAWAEVVTVVASFLGASWLMTRQTNKRVDDTKDNVSRSIDDLRNEMRRSIDGLRDEMKTFRSEVREDIRDLRRPDVKAFGPNQRMAD